MLTIVCRDCGVVTGAALVLETERPLSQLVQTTANMAAMQRMTAEVRHSLTRSSLTIM